MAMNDQSHIFWPHTTGPYERELDHFFFELAQFPDTTASINLIQRHLDDMPTYLNAEVYHLRYRAYLLVMQDLLRQGWTYQCRQGRIYLSPPQWATDIDTPEDVNAQKDAIRQLLNYERQAQLHTSSVQEFIRFMERPRMHKDQTVSIHDLFADGSQLAQDLQEIASMPDEQAQQAIGTCVQPYLQLVIPDERCKHTGLRLNDIWRYFRHTWAIPYKPTPGRNMFYLIRDAAQPFHPVIGIAALGNSIMQITDRDDAIGWTTKALYKRINADEFSQGDAANIERMLKKTLQTALADIAKEDLIHVNELEEPTEETLNHLDKIAVQAYNKRITLLKEIRTLEHQLYQLQQQPLENVAEISSCNHRIKELKAQATEVLFRSKRASILQTLLFAKKTLITFPEDLSTVEGLRKCISTSEGQQAIRTLLRENKKQKIGINMMDLIVCGAVPPYTFLLGGKLVSMLMASPKIVYDYKNKYQNYQSAIASKMKKEPVIREPKLVFLGTTSLYQIGSSQYNRISIPSLQNESDKIVYKKYGKTLGFGSIHFSVPTIKALDKLQEHVREATLINNRFGEGVNPKLRRVRAGLSAIGLENSDTFINHHSKRIVYGIPLGKKTAEFLRGETDDPEYYFDVCNPERIKEATEHITHVWATRWLLMRIRKPEILQSVATFSMTNVILSHIIARNGNGVEASNSQPKQEVFHGE